MEANTVILALPEYNALRDFKTELEKGNTYRTQDFQTPYYNGCVVYPTVLFVSTDDAVKEIATRNKNLLDQNEELKKEINLLKNPPTVQSPSNLDEANRIIKEVKKMSVWEFRKWRKK
jgi:hypothetical protein